MTRYPDIKPSIFLGDAAFDTIEIYKSLFEDFNFTKAFIPLKVNLSMDNVKYTFNENGNTTDKTSPKDVSVTVIIPVQLLPAVE